MEGPASSASRRCSWCGTLNSAGANTCSKCGAVFSSIQRPIDIARAAVEAGIPAKTEGTRGSAQAEAARTTDQDAINALIDSSLFDKISGEAMKSIGFGPTFVSGQALAYFVAGCLLVYVLISLGAAFVDISQIQVLSKATPGQRTIPVEATSGEVLAALIRLLLVGTALLTAVFFLAWIYRAHKNLKALGATGLKYSPGWAIGGFFVPFLNIVRPYQVVSEIWKASAPSARRSGGTGWTFEETPVFISMWWASWLISGFVNSFSVFAIVAAGESNPLLVASRMRLVYDVINIACGALAMTVVFKINARQEDTNRLNSLADARRLAGSEIVRDQL